MTSIEVFPTREQELVLDADDYGVYGEDLSEWVEWQRFMAAVRAVSPDPLIIREAKEMDVPMPDGEVRRVAWSEVITSKTTLKALRERRARTRPYGSTTARRTGR